MNDCIIPADEPQRLAAVKRYDILDTPPDGYFDRITAMAARRFDVPISIISIVDNDRIWFKSHHGLDAAQIDRDPGLCASAILSLEPHIMTDARLDPRALANPLVAGDFGLRFYAGIPLRTSDGYNLGTLCVLDQKPRAISQVEVDELVDLASLVMDQMELRLSARDAVSRAQLMAREIDHRVMNSLHFVSGLLTMQSKEQAIPEAAKQLVAAATRVAAVARVHRHFYSTEADEVSCITFLRRLCEDLSGILERSVEITGDEGQVPSTSIQPIGLIVNELVTNAAKHGSGSIDVELQASDAHWELRVVDQGGGLPDDFSFESPNGLGMKVVSSLAKQLGGHLTTVATTTGAGACFSVVFPRHASSP